MSKRHGKSEKKKRCPTCGKIMRIGRRLSTTGTITTNTPRHENGALKRSREVIYERDCFNTGCSLYCLQPIIEEAPVIASTEE